MKASVYYCTTYISTEFLQSEKSWKSQELDNSGKIRKKKDAQTETLKIEEEIAAI